tara:strand:+ start:123 stop:476 length:354 start_codon:yes stop_codon:yes gene_type:complete
MTQFSSKLKSGDEVIVIAGKDKGKRGKIRTVLTKKDRVVVEGVNLVTKHMSQREAASRGVEPGKMQKEASIHVSNVMLADPKGSKATRLGYRFEKDGSKVRYAKGSGETVDVIRKGK